MFNIIDYFHITHVVDDLDATLDWYEEVFAPAVFHRSEAVSPRLALLAVADLVMMPLEPSTEVATGVAKFRSRFGQHLHSLAVHVDHPEDFMAHMASLGHRLTGARGGGVEGPGDEIWTNPREFPGLYELWAPRIEDDPRLADDWSPHYWRDEHPLGLRGPGWVTVLTKDRPSRLPDLLAAFRASTVHETAASPYGTASSFVALGTKVVIEIAEPLGSDTPAARDLVACGEILHAVTFEIADADAAADHLEGKGLRIERPEKGHVTVAPEDAYGVRFRFTETGFAAW